MNLRETCTHATVSVGVSLKIDFRPGVVRLAHSCSSTMKQSLRRKVPTEGSAPFESVYNNLRAPIVAHAFQWAWAKYDACTFAV